MLKLYYAQASCSLSPHIALREAGMAFELDQVNLQSKKTSSGDDYRAINPSGYVPTLILEDGQKLTEGPAILQFIADQASSKNLVPENGTFERYKLQQWLNFISTELHKSFAVLFRPDLSDDSKLEARQMLINRLEGVSEQLEKAPYLMGKNYTVADIYLFVVLSWAGYVSLDLSPWPSLTEFMALIGAREAVQQALNAEGLT